MAYSRSESTLIKMLPELQELALGRPQAWIVEEGNAHLWAQKVREALFVATLNREKYPTLAQAYDRYAVHVEGARVETRLKRRISPVVGDVGVAPSGTTRSVSVPGTQTPFTIIETWRKAQPSNNPIHFGEASLSEDQLNILYKWAQSWKPPLMLMVDGTSVTVGPADPHVAQYAWRPAEERAQQVAVISDRIGP